MIYSYNFEKSPEDDTGVAFRSSGLWTTGSAEMASMTEGEHLIPRQLTMDTHTELMFRMFESAFPGRQFERPPEIHSIEFTGGVSLGNTVELRAAVNKDSLHMRTDGTGPVLAMATGEAVVDGHLVYEVSAAKMREVPVSE